MAFKHIQTELKDGVAFLTLNRAPLNVLNIEMMEEINTYFEGLLQERSLKLIVIRGEGKAFSAGVDVGEHLGDLVRKMIADKEIVKVKDSYFDYPQTKYLPLRKANLSGLKANESELVDGVLNKLSDMNASEIRDYSHGDVPWLTTEDGKVIEYESVFYRTHPYSVRSYSGKDI